MKLLLYSVIGIVFIIALMLIGLSIASRKVPELGLVNGQLRPCPATPNCVCSEWKVEGAYVEPLRYSTSAKHAWDMIKQTIDKTGGIIVSEQNMYLHATYQTPLLRFIDDVEIRLDDEHKLIHIRSASRVGRSDMGTNRKRVAHIRTIFERQFKSSKTVH